MAPPATEIALITLKPGTDPSDPSNPAHASREDLFKTVSQQPGYQRLAWGIAEEEKNLLVLLVDWDSVEDHIRFTKSEVYKPFMHNLAALIEKPPTLYHVQFEDETIIPTTPLTKFNAAVHELFITYYPTDIVTPDFVHEISDNRHKATQLILDKPGTGIQSVAKGWTTEESVEWNGQQVRPYVLLAGWPSVDVHLKMRETQAFKDNVQLIRDGKGERWLVHVKLQSAF